MDPITLSLQLMQAAALVLLQIQAVSVWLLHLEEDDVTPRQKTIFQQRLEWDTFVSTNQHRPLFQRHLRMSYESFCLLLSMIDKHQKEVNKEMARRRGGEVIK